jgi:hypothetical protein
MSSRRRGTSAATAFLIRTLTVIHPFCHPERRSVAAKDLRTPGQLHRSSGPQTTRVQDDSRVLTRPAVQHSSAAIPPFAGHSL